MDCLGLIKKYYDEKSELYRILVSHSISVSNKAVKLGLQSGLDLDLKFVEEAAMLHDIGILYTDAPTIQCFGKHEYIEHGYLGAELLQKEGYPRHALVCERHTGTGITLDEITERNLPLPHREMTPISLEEQLICYADLFYSKTKLGHERTLSTVHRKVAIWGEASEKKLEQWIEMFGY